MDCQGKVTVHRNMPPHIFLELPRRHIRLLDLQAGEAGSPFHGSFRQTCIDDAPAYEALSYTWGPSMTSSVFQCDGSVIPLTANLELALSRLRLLDNTRVLWVDQICINQHDTIERGQQVSLMGEIYRNAEFVDIWLGEEDEDTKFAVAAIPNLLRCFANLEERDETGDEAPNVIGTLGILALRSRGWDAFRDIFQRPYFRRMWIVQEVVLGANCRVYCGSHIMQWNDMAKAALCLKTDSSRHVEAHRVVQMIRVLKRKLASAVDRPLLNLLSQTYNLQCTDPRDKLYGILGLSSDIHEGELVPDYGRSCQEIYIEVAKLCIHKYHSLAVLCCVRNPKGLSGLPSWVPDWNTIPATGEILGFRSSEKYSAAGTTIPSFKFSADGLILNTSGKSVDIIHRLGSIMMEETDQLSLEQVLHEWEVHARTASPYHTGEIYPAIFWRVLIADSQTRGNDSDKARQQLYESYDNLRTRNRLMANPLTQNDPWEPIAEMSIVNARTLEFEALFRAASSGRRLAITERGLLGLVASDAQVGDHICIFQSAQVPFVLRPRPNCDLYSLVGECYLQGWMDGSCFENFAGPSEEFAIS
jgi:hypothetical protein